MCNILSLFKLPSRIIGLGSSMNLLAHSSYLNHYNPYIVSMELLPTCLSAITLVEILYTVCYTSVFRMHCQAAKKLNCLPFGDCLVYGRNKYQIGLLMITIQELMPKSLLQIHLKGLIWLSKIFSFGNQLVASNFTLIMIFVQKWWGIKKNVCILCTEAL